MYWRTVVLTLLLVSVGLLVGCETTTSAPVEEGRRPPDVYRVVRGDTLYSIAFRYNLDYKEVARWNQLESADRIYAGQPLRLTPPGTGQTVAATGRQAVGKPPEATTASTSKVAQSPPKPSQKPAPRPTKKADAEPATVAKAEPKSAQPQTRRKVAGVTWSWPTSGKVVRSYNPGVPGRKGIQIGGNAGQSIKAASRGQVVYSGSGLPGYGRLIIVKHSESLLSAYGYLGEIYVKEGDQVKSGQAIANLGASNGNSSPVLHFEIRQNGKPVNPLKFLPS